jgi:uncharacterized protein DUF1888
MPHVKVKYNPNSTPVWTFDPDPVRLNASGTITFTQDQGAAWTFVSASVQNGGTQFGTPNPNQAGNEMTLTDAHTSNGQWCYTVTIHPNANQAGQNVTSPDPQIINDPPTPSPAPPAPT